ncbi:flagellar biosynthesis anti-sigma factor FlgM [Salsuginibacillus kocurii]|uniref:flagellar biosynthesis anti-sigma factor FlgM n=1 Tax=Salsuginibacillus kocurii TaxID=427078 RepID=UPI00037DA335|nr:flagellar biosynthesis anti-sigma factor FlgM [Salsuginibacillus kocurii]
MKINPLGPMNNPYRQQIDKQQAQNQQPGKKDQLEISETAKEMQQGEKTGDVRQDKINELKQKIDAGEYNVDPRQTAQNMYDFWTNN